MVASRLSPLARFGLISLVTMLLIGVALGGVLAERITHRALDGTAHTAEIVGAVVLEDEARRLIAGEAAAGARLDDHFQGERVRASGVKRVKVFDGARRLVYADDGKRVGTRAGTTSNVATALTGERVTSLARGTGDDGRGAQTLSVYAPVLAASGRGRPVGVFELYLDHGPTAAAARRDVATMWLLVAGGLLVLWGALFRLMHKLSSALRGKAAENRHQATHDALTALPNRVLLQERLEAALRAGGAALLLIDLDRFKEVNDTLGHDHGDALLVEVADRLRSVVREGDLVARMGGDEFAVICPGSTSEELGRALALRVTEALREPVDLEGTAVVVDASIGLALAPEHGRDVTTLVRHADVAMYEAKERRSSVETYDAARDQHHKGRLALLGELPRALSEGELVLAYQPKLGLGEEDVRGVEALVRWRHPEHGLLMPGAFIPSAEVTSLVRPLTLYVLDAALRQHKAWSDAGLQLPVAVNLAGPSVVDVELPDAVGRLLERHGVAPGALTLEISEQTIMTDIAGTLRVLGHLRELGVQLSLDDFGTGQTSLSQLRQLPLQELKVDRSLVAGDERVVRSIVEMGHRFGLQVVGEGVETPEVAERLLAAGCDEVQGFLYGRPMFAADLEAWAAARPAPVA